MDVPARQLYTLKHFAQAAPAGGGEIITPPDVTSLRAQSVESPGPQTVQGILSIVFVIVGAVAVIIMVIAGIKYAGSHGDPQGTAEARQTIIYALVGLAVVILATAIVNFVFERVIG